MPDQNSEAPETQDTPPKLYGGKYKSVEEMEAAYQESERVSSQLREDNDRMGRYISLMDQPPAAKEPDGTNGDGSDDEVPEPVKRFVRSELSAANASARKAREIEERFFQDYPDLADEEDLVLFHAMKLRQEPKAKMMSIAEVSAEVAKRARAQIERIRKADKRPPHVEGGSRGERPPVKTGAEESLNEDERLNAFIGETRARKQKHLGKG